MLFGSAVVASTAVPGITSTAARDIAVISTLSALLVAAGRFGVVVELGAFVFEAPRAVVGLNVDSVGPLLVCPVAALLMDAHMVLERGHARLI